MVALIGAVLGLILVVLGSSTHVAAQSGSDPEATLTVVITSGDDTVSWSDPDACTSDYNTYLSVSSGPDSGTKTRTHIGSVASGSTEATQAISYNYTGDSLNPPACRSGVVLRHFRRQFQPERTDCVAGCRHVAWLWGCQRLRSQEWYIFVVAADGAEHQFRIPIPCLRQGTQ